MQRIMQCIVGETGHSRRNIKLKMYAEQGNLYLNYLCLRSMAILQHFKENYTTQASENFCQIMRKVNGMSHFNAINLALLKTIGKVNTFALKFTAHSKYLI